MIQFGGLASSGSVAAAAVAWVVGVSMVAGTLKWLMRGDRDAVPSSTATFLFGLRTAAVALLLFVLLFDPAITRPVAESIPGTVLVAVDQSASMRLADPPEAVTRHDANRGAIDRTKLLDRLKAKHAVEVTGFDIEPQPFVDASLPNDSSALTDYGIPLRRAAAIGPGLVGVVLFGDGRQTYGPSPEVAIEALVATGVPVFPVVGTAATSQPDIAVVSAKAPSGTALKGAVVAVEVRVAIRHWPAGLVHVTIAPPGGKPVTVTVGHPGGDATHAVTVPVKLETAGTRALPVTASATGAVDRIPENDTRTVVVTVVKDKARVLLVDGEPRWEFHYLHTALGRDPNVDLRSICFRQPRLGTAGDRDLKAQGFPGTQLPDPDVLSAYDLVVLGDVAPGELSAAWRSRLERFVADDGGTLVLSAGKQSMPLAFANLTSDPIRRLLPIADPVVWTSEAGSSIEATADSDRFAFLRLADSAAASRDVWGRFPPFHWAVAGTPKPGTTVLATLPAADGAAVPAVAVMPYGFGRTVFVGVDSTWRLRFKAGDQFHHRLWGQLAAWAAADRLLPAVNAAGTVRFGPREPTIEAGRDVPVVLRFTDEVPPPKGLATATVVRVGDGPDRPIATLPLTGRDDRPRERTATVGPLPPGRYAVELSVPEWVRELDAPLRAPLTVTAADAAELADPTPDRDFLERLAKATGGKVVPPESLEEIVDLLAVRTASRDGVVLHRLRHSWWLLGTIVLLLAVEWVVRKWHGLP